MTLYEMLLYLVDNGYVLSESEQQYIREVDEEL